ncbi:MAG TPA: GerMN domain-containing protein [Thermaerobacter sp.]
MSIGDAFPHFGRTNRPGRAQRRRAQAVVPVLLLSIALLLSACGHSAVGSGPNEVVIAPDGSGGQGGLPMASSDLEGTPAIVPNPGDERVTITLFYGSRSGLLDPWPWRRTVDRPQRTADLARIALENLLEPPANSPFVSVLPKGTRVLSVSVDDSQQTAYVNFSEEFIKNHPGGSYGEGVTIHAIVQTLTGIPGIRRVQILVEGKPVETLAGHIAIDQPLERLMIVPGGPLPEGAVPDPTATDEPAAAGAQGEPAAGAGAAGDAAGAGSSGSDGGWTPWQMEIDDAVMNFFQDEVVQGRMQWLTDPVEAARYLATTYGFYGWDEYVLLHRTDRGEGSGLGEALVRVRHGNSYYTLHMIQPREQGDQGIWVIHDVRSRAIQTGRKPVDPDLVRGWQEEVDGGANLWRLDPVDAVRHQGGLYGFDPYSDEFTLVQVDSGQGRAVVRVKHDGREYEVLLTQPVRKGDRGVWWIDTIRAVAPETKR